MKMPGSSAGVLNAVLALLLVALAVAATLLVGTLRAQQRLAHDRAELDHAKYGLLNADAWVEQVGAIVQKKVRAFELTGENRAAVKMVLERMVGTLINEADARLRRQQTAKRSFWERTTGRMKLDVKDALIDMKEVRAGIPGYAEAILGEMEKPQPREELNVFVRNLLSEATHTTFAQVDRRLIDDIHARYGCADRNACQRAIRARAEDGRERAVGLTLAVLVLTTLMFSIAVLAPGRNDRLRLALLALCCTALLACGVLTPMIEVEARISALRFVLLGEPVAFTDQVLYFQSKSVTDVVRVLTATGQADMVAVGGLIMLFSVIFPLLKLCASLVYLYDPGGLRGSAVVRFFALKSGKWSMADVFVVAIFMAFIGFNGLISSQLGSFASAAAPEVDVLTTNGTALQVGFFMFLAFCLASLLASTIIDSVMPVAAARPPAAAPAPFQADPEPVALPAVEPPQA